MVDMGVGTFIDKQHRPASKEILEVVGAKKELWETLERFVTDNYRVKSDLAFYGRNYGWAVRFRKAGKALLSMYPTKESFTVQIILSEDAAKKASSLRLGKNASHVLENAHRFPEGRWLFIGIGSKQDIVDVEQLLLLKTRLLKKESE